MPAGARTVPVYHPDWSPPLPSESEIQQSGADPGAAIASGDAHVPGGAGAEDLPTIDANALTAALSGLGLAMPQEAMAILEEHARMVVEANRHLNLTRITDPVGVAVQHVADSLAALLALHGDALSVVDVGSGAGYPGIVLAAARPLWRVTLIESAAKKAAFLDTVVRELGLAERVTVVCARAEDAGRSPALRQKSDAAVARAVAPLAPLMEYLLPLVRIGGRVVAMRGRAGGDELAASARAVKTLGGGPASAIAYELPGLEAERHLVIVKKMGDTPAAYPRRPGIPQRQPLL